MLLSAFARSSGDMRAKTAERVSGVMLASVVLRPPSAISPNACQRLPALAFPSIAFARFARRLTASAAFWSATHGLSGLRTDGRPRLTSHVHLGSAQDRASPTCSGDILLIMAARSATAARVNSTAFLAGSILSFDSAVITAASFEGRRTARALTRLERGRRSTTLARLICGRLSSAWPRSSTCESLRFQEGMLNMTHINKNH